MDKKSKLTNFAEKIISAPENQDEVSYLLDKLNLNREEIVKAYLDWDLDPDSYGNEIYKSIPLRFAMYLHYLLKGSWHEIRQDEISKLLNEQNNASVIDIGFGAPQKYVRDSLLNKSLKITLAEFDDSALIFSKTLLDYWDPNWKENIKLKKYDMDEDGYVGNFDIYMFQDSIEHTKNPTQYLQDLIKKSPINSKFIFSLPIEGESIATNSHSISWQTEKDVVEWLNKCGLEINYSKPIQMNSAIDLFAQGMNFYESIYECTKK